MRLHPYGLVLNQDRIYCVALDTVRGSLGTYALERMRDVAAHSEERFDLPTGFQLHEHFCGELGPAQCAEAEEVVLELSAPLARELAGARLHPSQKWSAVAGGSARLSLRLLHPELLVPRLLSWGAEARVIEPSRLRSAVLKRLQEAAAAYATQ